MDLQTECNDTTNEVIQNTSQQGSDSAQNDQPTSKKPIDSEQRTDHDGGKSNPSFTLLDLCRLTFSLDGVEVLNAQDATNEQFGALADVVSDVTNVEQWYLEERRDFINGLQAFCEEHDYPFPFTLVDEEPEEGTPTAPLRHDSEETGFLYDVEHARPAMRDNPEISAKELADALGLHSEAYAQTVKVYVNAHKSTEKGAK
jgi:hypothetical protein